MTIDLTDLDLTKAVKEVPGWLAVAVFVTSLLMLAVTIKNTFFNDPKVILSEKAWVCTKAIPNGITAVCASYERREQK